VLRSRIIPCLLIRRNGLVKTLRFEDQKYVGDPINAVKIYNEKQVDELMVVDIDATTEGREPNFELIRNLAAESRMPLCYGGGVTTAAQAQQIISLGVEKVAVSAAAIERPALISEMAEQIGTQSVVVVLDVKKRRLSRSYNLMTHNATKKQSADPIVFAAQAEQLGAGEIVLNSIDNDGVMQGYDLNIAQKLRDGVSIPITVLGGAGDVDHMQVLIEQLGTVGAAAGSLFVFKGPYKAVLISYARPSNAAGTQ